MTRAHLRWDKSMLHHHSRDFFRKCLTAAVIVAAASAVLPAFGGEGGRTGPWPKEKAWAWYNAQPWIRGVNFVPSDCVNFVDLWQEHGFEERFATAERELALAAETGFNTVRLFLQFEVWLCEPAPPRRRTSS